MGAQPLEEAYEKLKALRRQGESPEHGIDENADQRFVRQLLALLEDGGSGEYADYLRTFYLLAADEPREIGTFIRLLEIRTLADRVFGDETKAEAWLYRKNPSFSGQKPIDLLKDELGAAVVREALEQIDHGIFA